MSRRNTLQENSPITPQKEADRECDVEQAAPSSHNIINCLRTELIAAQEAKDCRSVSGTGLFKQYFENL